MKLNSYSVALAISTLVGVALVFLLRPTNAHVWFASVVAMGALGIFGAASMRLRMRKQSTLNQRPDITNDELYETYFKDSGLPKAIVVELWDEVAACLHVPRAKMRPTDRLGKEVGGYWITSEDLDALEARAKNRARHAGKSLDVSTIDDVGGYVRMVGALIAQ
jgi:hypothetical protein